MFNKWEFFFIFHFIKPLYYFNVSDHKDFLNWLLMKLWWVHWGHMNLILVALNLNIYCLWYCFEGFGKFVWIISVKDSLNPTMLTLKLCFVILYFQLNCSNISTITFVNLNLNSYFCYSNFCYFYSSNYWYLKYLNRLLLNHH